MKTESAKEIKESLDRAIESLQNLKTVRGFIILAMEEEPDHPDDVEEIEVTGVNAICGNQKTFNLLLSNLNKDVMNHFSVHQVVNALAKNF